MPATRKSPRASDAAPDGRRSEIITIVAAALARLIQTDSILPAPRADTPASMAAANLSESAKTGLELSDETRLSVPAG